MKNRVQKFSDFFACLQREYLVAELRYKIYPRQKDKDYYLHREMEGKKKTIESISARNNFPSIFNDTWLRDKYKAEIYNEFGLPNFIYRSSEDRENRRPKDILAYFHKGVPVKGISDEGFFKGVIVWTDLDNNTATIDIDGETQVLPFDNLQRIF